MPIENRNLEPGTQLRASYKKEVFVCTVEAGEEENRVVFVLEDGSRYKSPSAAASKIMGGKAVNGWRFWTVEGDEAPGKEKPKAEKKGRGKKKSNKTIVKTPSQTGVAQGQSRWFCSACMDAFTQEGTEEPEACPKGHR